MLLAAVMAVTALGGCGGEAVPRAAGTGHIEPPPSPSVSPSPSPTPEPEPVAGVVEVRTLDASEPGLLGLAEDAPPDEQRAATIARRVAAAIDTHLTAVQDGSEDLAGLDAMWAAADEAVMATLTTSLTGPELLVETVRHDVVVHWEAGPTVAVVTTTVERSDGSTAAVDLVFDVTGEQPRLQLVGAGTPDDGGAV